MSASYEYDAYVFVDARPLVRIARRDPTSVQPLREGTSVRVAEYHLDWTWLDPCEIDLSDGLCVSVLPFENPGRGRAYVGKTTRYGLSAFGRCSAFVRRWGATVPLDMMDPRVIAGLREREKLEAFAWLVG